MNEMALPRQIYDNIGHLLMRLGTITISISKYMSYTPTSPSRDTCLLPQLEPIFLSSVKCLQLPYPNPLSAAVHNLLR